MENFKEFVNSEQVKSVLDYMDCRDIPAVQRATTIMALKRIYEEASSKDPKWSPDGYKFARKEFYKHIMKTNLLMALTYEIYDKRDKFEYASQKVCVMLDVPAKIED